jgi:glycosyltransferase involved in cell wall biosynthesis
MPESYSWRFRALYRTLQPIIVRRAVRIATVSHDAARQLAQYLPVALRDVEILPNGHEHALRWDAAAAGVFREKPQIRPFVLILGSRAWHKNIALILGLAERLDALGVEILVAGGDGGIFAGTEAVQAANIRRLGRVSDDDLALLFGRALCLAFPSLTEGFGLPVLEAMALGCPVVSSDRSSLPEICGDAALMASPDDPDAWLRHITALAGSSALRVDLRGRGRIQAARYSWDRTAAGYADLCGRLS